MSEPHTPERHRAGEREQDRVNRLQMTSPDERRQRARPERVLNPPVFNLDGVGQVVDDIQHRLGRPSQLLQAPRSPPRVQNYYPAPAHQLLPPHFQPVYNPGIPVPYAPAYYPVPFWGNFAHPAQPVHVVGNFYPMNYPQYPPMPHHFPPPPLHGQPQQFGPLPAAPNPFIAPGGFVQAHFNPDPDAPYVPPNLGLDGNHFQVAPEPEINNRQRGQRERQAREHLEHEARIAAEHAARITPDPQDLPEQDDDEVPAQPEEVSVCLLT